MKTSMFVSFSRRWGLSTHLLLTTWFATVASVAHAQAEGSPLEEPAPEPTPAPGGASPKAAQPPTAPVDAGRLYLEVLPAEAYPSHDGGGIPGGSLRGTMGGLQWPYMPARAGDGPLRVGVSGSFWVDGSRRSLETGLDTEPDRLEYRHQGRFVFRTTPVYNLRDDWFVQAQAEAVVNADQDDGLEQQYVEGDDLWVRTGMWDVFDVQVGRLQGWEVYHLGMGLDLNTFERNGAEGPSSTPKPLYTVSDMWDRGKSEGSLAAHLYPTAWARVEVQARFGLAGNGNFIGVRPVGILDFGFVKLKAGYEQSTTPAIDIASDSRIDSRGLGAGLDVVLDPWVELGASFGNVAREQFDADNGQSLKGSATTLTYGGYVNGRIIDGLVLGLGYHTLQWENLNSDPVTGSDPDHDTNTLMFGAIQYALFDRLTLKYVFSPSKFSRHERAEGAAVPQEFTNESVSHRIRFAVTF